jgi:transposase
MPNPHPTALRARAVHAYEAGNDSYALVATRFEVGVASLQRWVRRQRTTGAVDPLAKGGGWRSPVDRALLEALVKERPDRTTEELTRAYNQRAARSARVHRSSVLRALQRLRYVFKKNDRGRPSSIVRASETSGPPSKPGPRR